MSGGEWDYFHRRFISKLESFCEDITKRFPSLAPKLLEKGNTISKIINDIDYDVSGDSIIQNDEAFEKRSIERLRDNK